MNTLKLSEKEVDDLLITSKTKISEFYPVNAIDLIIENFWTEEDDDIYEDNREFDLEFDLEEIPYQGDETKQTENFDSEDIVLYQYIEPFKEDTWFIGFTDGFKKSIRKVDKKLKGRILEAIGEICLKPCSIKGDTVKPLTGELSGLWRYRIGDYRLFYKPDENSKQVTLLRFDSRGSAY